MGQSLNRRGALLACMIVFLAGIGLRVWGAVGASGWPFALTATVRQSGSLALGAILALTVRAEKGRIFASAVLPTLGLVSAGAYVLLLQIDSDGPEWVKPVCGPTLLGIAFSGLVARIVLSPTGVMSRLFACRPLQFFGKYSYGLYVYHHLMFPAWLAIFAYLYQVTGIYRLAAFGMVLTATSVSVAVSMVSWALFERPILGLKRHFEYSPPSAQ